MIDSTVTKNLKSKRIAVVLGGHSKEREVSLRTGTAIFNSLSNAGYNVQRIDPKEEGLSRLSSENFDVAFLALHGNGGEDGQIQGFLESVGLSYTGCDVLASAICFDKIRTKQVLKNYDVLTPAFEEIIGSTTKTSLPLPVIVKPSREGSTIGMTIVKEEGQVEAAIALARQSSSDVLIEQFVKGSEVTVSVLDGQAFPSVEIVPRSGFYDYQSKYTSGATDYFCPGRFDPEVEKKLSATSEMIYKALHLKGAIRCDYILDEKGHAYFLEVNTIPGMTETSLLPKAAKAAGLSFLELCEAILSSAFAGKGGSE